MRILIRRANEKDLTYIQKLYKKAFEKDYPDWLEWFNAIKQDLPTDKRPTWVVECKNRIIGFYIANFKPQMVKANAIYVEPMFRRKGVGSKLLKAMEEYARTCGIEDIWTSCFADDKVALSFLLRNQFLIDKYYYRENDRKRCLLHKSIDHPLSKE